MAKELKTDVQFEKINETEECLNLVKKILLPEISDNSNKGHDGSDFIGNTYQIYRTILHKLAIDNNWNNVYSSPTLPSGNLGDVKIETVNTQKVKKKKIMTKENKQDNVNHPNHYGGKDNPFEAIKVIEHYDLNFNIGNAIKYILRAGKKDIFKQDLEKAVWYLNRELSKH